MENIDNKTINDKIKLFFNSIFKAELVKYQFSKLLTYSFLFSFLSILITYLLIISFMKGNGSVVDNGFLNYLIGAYFVISFPIAVAFITSETYKIEFESKAKKRLYLQPISRSQVFYSKLLISFLFALSSIIFLLIQYLIVLFYEILFNNAQSSELNKTASVIFTIITSSSIAILPIIIIHQLISSLKINFFINLLAALILSITSIILISFQVSNIWWNIYTYPLLIFKNAYALLFKEPQLIANNWLFANNLWLNIAAATVASIILIFASRYVANKLDRVY